MVLLIDNYDSFSYNLVQMIGAECDDVRVVRNDRITPEEIERLHPDRLVLSPGPGFPKDAGVCVGAVRRLAGKIPVLGVCLGHQSIGESFGGRIVHAPKLMHGKTSPVRLDTACPIFRGLPEQITAMRYHSLVVERETLPACLEVTAAGEDGEVMALVHREYPVYGVQFHPESFMTVHGPEIIRNFLRIRTA